jgi:hypothetical protein
MTTTFLNDTFTAANGTLVTARAGETGAAWAAHPTTPTAAFTIQTNRAYPSTAGILVPSGAPGSNEYDITAPLRYVSGTANLGILFGLDATLATYYTFWLSSGNAWQLRKTLAGTASTLDTEAATVVANTTYTMRVDRRRGLIRCYVDGVLVLEATDTDISGAGLVGIRDTVAVTTTTGKHFESISGVWYAPVAVNVGADATVNEDTLFTQEGSFTDEVGTPWTATVDYGDGGGAGALTLAGNNFTLSHTYTTPGVYTVTVVVTDAYGETGSDTLTVTVLSSGEPHHTAKRRERARKLTILRAMGVI